MNSFIMNSLMRWLIKFNTGETPKVSSDIVKKPVHKYPGKVAKDNFRIKQFSLRYSVS